MLLREIKRLFQKELEQDYPIEEIDSFFYWMTTHYLGLERFVLVLEPNYILTKEEEQPLFEGLSKLKEGVPLQYILEGTEFMGLHLFLNNTVLIPRPETEELVNWILQDFKHSKEGLRVLDMGTGSGCIAIALAKYLKNARLEAIDISKEALSVAKKNAEQNEVSVEFRLMDMLNPSSTQKAEYDIIVSNPPYVKLSEKSKMHRNVLDYEPELALFVTDDDPLVFYKALIKFSINALKTSGSMYLEINETEGASLVKALGAGGFSNVVIRKDIFGKERMVRAQL